MQLSGVDARLERVLLEPLQVLIVLFNPQMFPGGLHPSHERVAQLGTFLEVAVNLNENIFMGIFPLYFLVQH